MQADKQNHFFKPNSRFDDVIALYNFDRELRLLLFDVIERIEIGLRSKMIYHLSHEFDAWWFQNPELFLDTRAFIKTLAGIEEELDRSKDIFIKDHLKRYKADLRFPPAWKTLEITSFGSLSETIRQFEAHGKIKGYNRCGTQHGQPYISAELVAIDSSDQEYLCASCPAME